METELEPPRKVRKRLMQCHCRMCKGKERDYRTIQKHTSNHPTCMPDTTDIDSDTSSSTEQFEQDLEESDNSS